jgi:hypothetical protein
LYQIPGLIFPVSNLLFGIKPAYDQAWSKALSRAKALALAQALAKALATALALVQNWDALCVLAT